MKKIEEEKVVEEVKISVPKFTRPEVVEELTKKNIEDVIAGQEKEVEYLERELSNKKACINHYKPYLK